MLADPFWIVQAAFSNIHFSQDKYSSFAIWIHGADKICDITTLSIQRTIYTSLTMCYNDSAKHNSFLHEVTRSSTTKKSTVHPSCLVGVLYDIYRQTNIRSTANQPFVRNWP